MDRRARSFAIVLVMSCGAVSTAASCSDPEVLEILRQLGDPCSVDSDCVATPLPDHPDAKAACVFGRCHVECETTPDCKKFGLGDDIRCITEETPTNVCQLADEVTCADPAKPLTVVTLCPGNLHCAPDGKCRNGCASESDCLVGQTCVVASCAEVGEDADGLKTTPVQCQYDSQCPGLLVCLDHVCAEECLTDEDCAVGTCVVEQDDAAGGPVHHCVPPTGPTNQPAHCSTHAKDDDESDVDCGGSCVPCAPGKACGDASDCTSLVCDASVCKAPTCFDLVRNGTESGPDCGGTCMNGCAPGVPCDDPSDCAAGATCIDLVCTSATCADQTKNGLETDVDCGGGACPKCADTEECLIGGDCVSLICTAFTCETATCSDNLKNGLETGVDCGGASGCSTCPTNAPCMVGTDCASGVCGANLKCAAATCPDGVMNGTETGLDCGGGCATKCGAGAACVSDLDCVAGTGCHPTTSICTTRFVLNVTSSGPGSVASTPAGIACPGDCSESYFDNEPITLTANVQPSATFQGWNGGPCSGTAPCSFAITGTTNVSATFTGAVAQWQQTLPPPRGLAYDSAGNFYIGGAMTGPFTPQGGPTVVHVPLGATNPNAYVMKRNPAGAHAWARSIGSPSNTTNTYATRSIVTTSASDVVVILQADGAFVADLTNVPCAGTSAIGLVKYGGAAGDFLFGQCFGNGVTIVDAVAAANDDVVIVGTFAGTTNFGGGSVGAVSGTDAFIARYSGATGAFVGAKVLGGGNMSVVNDILRVGTGFVVTGTCVGATTFDAVTTVPPVDAGSTDLCAVQLDANLNAVWALSEGGSQADDGWAATFLPPNEVVIAGTFAGDHNFGAGTLSAGADPDIILLRRSALTGAPSGSPATHHTPCIGGSGCTQLADIATDPLGRLQLLGTASNGAAFGDSGPWLATFSAFGVFQAVKGNANTITAMRVGPSGQVLIAATNNGSGDPWGVGTQIANSHASQLIVP